MSNRLLTAAHVPYLTFKEIKLANNVISIEMYGGFVYAVDDRCETFAVDASSKVEAQPQHYDVEYTVTLPECRKECCIHECSSSKNVKVAHNPNVSGRRDGIFPVFFLKDNKVLPLRLHTGTVTDVTVVDENNVITASKDKTIIVWHISDTIRHVKLDLSKYGTPAKLAYNHALSVCTVRFFDSRTILLIDFKTTRERYEDSNKIVFENWRHHELPCVCMDAPMEIDSYMGDN